MKIFRPERYHKTFRITFSKKVNGKTEKKAVTVVETTREELDSLICETYSGQLKRRDEKPLDFVKLTVQIIKCETGKPRGKDEWSYRLYRTDFDDIEKLTDRIDAQNTPTGSRQLKDITDAELAKLVELSGMYGVKSFWGDIHVTEIDRMMFDNTICIDYEQTRIKDGVKSKSTMYFNYNELSYNVAMEYPYERMSDTHSVCERTQMFFWLMAQGFNMMDMLTYAPVDPKGQRTSYTCGYIVGDRHSDWFSFENARYFGSDDKRAAKDYLEKEKTEGRRLRLYRLVDDNLHEDIK